MAEPNSSTDKAAEVPAGGHAGEGEIARTSTPKVPSAGILPGADAAEERNVGVEVDKAPSEKSELARVALEGLSDLRPKNGASATLKAAEPAQDHAPARSDAPPKDPPKTSQAKLAVAPSGEAVSPLHAYELLARSPRLPDLVGLTSRIVGEAARNRVASWSFGPAVLAAADDTKLTRVDADTRFGNVLDVLGTGGETEAERALASALWAHAVAESPRERTEDEDRVAGDVLWLATHSSFDATSLLDRALGEEAADLWIAIADRIRRIARGRGGALGRGEAIVGVAALAASGSEKAKRLSADLANELRDPVLLRILAPGESATPEEVRFEGELLSAPRGVVATTLLAFTGLLFAIHAVRLVARVALAYRRPAEVSFTGAGVRVKSRVELLGRTLREREQVIVRSGLVRVVREVRFPRMAFYAGLLALAVGSYVGVRAFVDGVRSASPSLLLAGLLILALGVAADFVLGSILPGSRGRCRIAFVPRQGATLCVGDVDIRRADDALARSLAR